MASRSTSEGLGVYVIDEAGGLLVEGNLSPPTGVTWSWALSAVDESGHLVMVGTERWNCDTPTREPICNDVIVLEMDTATGHAVLNSLPRTENRNPYNVGFANGHIYVTTAGASGRALEVIPSGLPLAVARVGGYWRG